MTDHDGFKFNLTWKYIFSHFDFYPPSLDYSFLSVSNIYHLSFFKRNSLKVVRIIPGIKLIITIFIKSNDICITFRVIIVNFNYLKYIFNKSGTFSKLRFRWKLIPFSRNNQPDI